MCWKCASPILEYMRRGYVQKRNAMKSIPLAPLSLGGLEGWFRYLTSYTYCRLWPVVSGTCPQGSARTKKEAQRANAPGIQQWYPDQNARSFTPCQYSSAIEVRLGLWERVAVKQCNGSSWWEIPVVSTLTLMMALASRERKLSQKPVGWLQASE